MKKIISTLVVIAVLLAACSNSKQNKIDKIKELEKIVSSKTDTFNIKKANELVEAYVDFADAFPKDTMAAPCYYKAASILMNTGDPNKAVELFDKIINNYPDYKKLPDCMFMKAFTYDNFLQNKKKAEECYNAFIKKYPDNEFADDAKSLLEMLNKTPEEIAAELDAKLKADTVKKSE
ncbi:MAG TPA: tetratricopeptide repeat protein [Bacteroidales bacterium]|nr:tetratricopeptide repeat protein [Bacteroidales bacterium]HPS16561.1 tetratricopeptide repeat protein [Bacteroidales bacterium]